MPSASFDKARQSVTAHLDLQAHCAQLQYKTPCVRNVKLEIQYMFHSVLRIHAKMVELVIHLVAQ